jgi:hypothetical protein
MAVLTAIFFSTKTDLDMLGDTYAEGTATQGCDRSADIGAGMAGRREPPFRNHPAFFSRCEVSVLRFPLPWRVSCAR